MFYQMARMTGLRRQELMQLVWGDIHLDGDTPSIQLRADTTKSKRADSVPLHGGLASDLRSLRKDAGSNDRIFRSNPSIASHWGWIKKAGIASKDDRGCRADFHALRKTFGTSLGVAGISQITRMACMRHTDSRLTDNTYTDGRLLGTHAAVQGLP